MTAQGSNTSAAPTDEETLVRAFAGGEAEVVQQVRVWVEAVVRYGNWRLDDPEAVVQEILAKLVRLVRGERFQRRSSFKTFVFSVAKHSCVDAFRRDSTRSRFLSPEEAPEAASDGSDLGVRLERRELVRYILQRLPESCIALWQLIYREGLSAGEAGARLGLAAGTVRVRAHRCLQKARAIGAELEEEGFAL